jgi:SpoIID/LytB domain protein
LPHGEWRAQYAIGEGDELLFTPIQLITAYAALFNGGHLYVPQRGAAQSFTPHERAQVEIAPAHRALLMEGMRGAVVYGTAAKAGLYAVPQYIFGKTGTSTFKEEFRAHGWFVGFAADSRAKASPDSINLAVLVFLKHAHGIECAELARKIFAAYSDSQQPPRIVAPQAAAHEENSAGSGQSDAPAHIDASQSAASLPVRVHLVRENSTEELSLEDYVFGVLAAEGSVENQLEALKAQAVVSRTYALKNIKRHARDGYDFCNNTHCQRYLFVSDESRRADFYALLHRAVGETRGEILRDSQGNIADAYFSASCGGITANINSLWGVPAPAYLRGVRDDCCASAANQSWTDKISGAQLVKALRSDSRSDVGARLSDVRVVKRDATGRAETIELQGERRRTLRGWDFKIIVGRFLGWDVLKSSLFDVARAGSDFVFRGSGFGHGLGLCQTGAHVRAERGASYRQIISQYFPGAIIGGNNIVARANKSDDQSENLSAQRFHHARELIPEVYQSAHYATASLMTLQPAIFQSIAFTSVTQKTLPRLTLASENFRVIYSAHTNLRDVEAALRTLETARMDLSERLAAASLNLRAVPKLDLIVHDTTGDFVAATGQPSWTAATTIRASRIETQPLDVLQRRGVFATTLRHEYAHALIEALGHGRAPRWLSEGLAMRFAGEGASSSRAEQVELSRNELERRLAQPASAEEMFALYAAAYRQVSALIRADGEAKVWRRVAQS